MYILRERGILGDFECVQDKVESCKEKWISALNPFRSEMTKTTILHKKCISERSRSTYLKQNDLERDFIHWKGSAILVGRFQARRTFYRPQTCQNPQSKIAKIMIFWNILKIDLKGFWCRFRVQNSSKTHQVCIYDHISCTRPPPAELSKIDFLAKIVTLAIFEAYGPVYILIGHMFKSGDKCDFSLKISEKHEKHMILTLFSMREVMKKLKKHSFLKLFVSSQDSSCQVCVGVGAGKNAGQWQRLKKLKDFKFFFPWKLMNKS